MKKLKEKIHPWMALILWYVPVFIVQLISANTTISSLSDWYTGLSKPSYNPPNWLFGPVWTLLYIMITFSVWFIYIQKPPKKKRYFAYFLFWLQLLLNLGWSYIFFGHHKLGLAALDLILLVIVVFVMTLYYFRLKALSGILLVPYFIWICYALILNLAFWVLN